MEVTYRKRDECKTIVSVIERNTGKKITEITNPNQFPHIPGIPGTGRNVQSVPGK